MILSVDEIVNLLAYWKRKREDEREGNVPGRGSMITVSWIVIQRKVSSVSLP
jgi:hypothetical protein